MSFDPDATRLGRDHYLGSCDACVVVRCRSATALFALHHSHRIAFIPIAINFGLKPYQQQRITAFTHPDIDKQGSAWAINQSLIAIGSGGWSGKGFKAPNTQIELGFLPATAVHNDYIFSAVAEQWGFVGGILLIGGFALLLLTCLFVAFFAGDQLGLLLVVGVTALIFTHIFQNVGMTIAMLPITGVPLPLISYSGSFVLDDHVRPGPGEQRLDPSQRSRVTRLISSDRPDASCWRPSCAETIYFGSCLPVKSGRTDMDADYKVKLEVFEGPLDLLLYLIKQDEIDIYDISLERITSQYLEYLQAFKELNIELAGEFIVMAANLIYLKSRSLLPRDQQPPEEDAAEDDPRWELIRQLIEYKKFKEAAAELNLRALEQERIFIREAGSSPELQEPLRLGEVGIFQLISAFQTVMKRMEARQDVQEIFSERFSVSEKIDSILQRVATGTRFRFSDLFSGAASRIEVVVTFLALLELIRLKQVRALQKNVFDEIEITAA